MATPESGGNPILGVGIEAAGVPQDRCAFCKYSSIQLSLSSTSDRYANILACMEPNSISGESRRALVAKFL